MASARNLGEALQRCLSPHLTTHRKQQTKQLLDPPPVPPIKRTPRLSAEPEHVVQLHRAERVARYEQAMALRKQGLSHQAIAQRVGVGHSTVQRWIAAGTFPERKRREQASQLDPYLALIREQWALGCHNAASICRTLLTKGYRGSSGSLSTLIARWRQGDPLTSRQAEALVPSKQATWLFLRRPEDLTAQEQDTVIQL